MADNIKLSPPKPPKKPPKVSVQQDKSTSTPPPKLPDGTVPTPDLEKNVESEENQVIGPSNPESTIVTAVGGAVAAAEEGTEELTVQSNDSSVHSRTSTTKSRLDSITSAMFKPFEALRVSTEKKNKVEDSTAGTSADTATVVADTPPKTARRGSTTSVIREGLLSKMNREGKFERYIFTLTQQALTYCKEGATAAAADNVDTEVSGEGDMDKHYFPLNALLVL